MQSVVTELGDAGVQLTPSPFGHFLCQLSHQLRKPPGLGIQACSAIFIHGCSRHCLPIQHSLQSPSGGGNIPKLHKVEATATYPSRQGPVFKTAQGVTMIETVESPNPLVWFTEMAGFTPVQPVLKCQGQLATH